MHRCSRHPASLGPPSHRCARHPASPGPSLHGCSRRPASAGPPLHGCGRRPAVRGRAEHDCMWHPVRATAPDHQNTEQPRGVCLTVTLFVTVCRSVTPLALSGLPCSDRPRAPSSGTANGFGPFAPPRTTTSALGPSLALRPGGCAAAAASPGAAIKQCSNAGADGRRRGGSSWQSEP
jgi:hypothetical protein